MNKEDAIVFFLKYQPLPNDGEELEAIIVNGREEVSHLWSSKMSHTIHFTTLLQ